MHNLIHFIHLVKYFKWVISVIVGLILVWKFSLWKLWVWSLLLVSLCGRFWRTCFSCQFPWNLLLKYSETIFRFISIFSLGFASLLIYYYRWISFKILFRVTPHKPKISIIISIRIIRTKNITYICTLKLIDVYVQYFFNNVSYQLHHNIHYHLQ